MDESITGLIKQGESISLEFKETFDRETIETAGAFANTKGGSILIGLSVRGKCFRRVGSSNRIMTTQEISEMHLHSIGSSWDVFPAQGKTIADIDLKKVVRYIKEANVNGRRKIEDEPKDVLQKLEFVKDKKSYFGSNSCLW